MDNSVLLDKMRARLSAALSDKGISPRAASLKAGLGPSYASGILKEGKDPQITFLARLCEANGMSLSWVLYGVEISPETEKLIKLIESNPEKRDAVISLFQTQ